MALPSSGSISIAQIEAELRLTVNGTGRTVEQLYDAATGAINKVAPYLIPDDWYGYVHSMSFILSTVSYSNAGDACDDTDIGAIRFFDGGGGSYPEVGDIIRTDGQLTTAFNGGGNWYRIVAEDASIRISSTGEVLQKEACNQTLSISAAQTTFDKSAASVTITVNSNTSWTLSTNRSWATWSNGTQTISGTGSGVQILDLAENTSGSDRSVTVTGVYALGSTSFDIEQLGIAYISTSLAYDASSSATACGGSLSPAYATDTGSLSTATFIGENIIPSGVVPATAGFYSDGSVWKEWNGSSVVATGLCI